MSHFSRKDGRCERLDVAIASSEQIQNPEKYPKIRGIANMGSNCIASKSFLCALIVSCLFTNVSLGDENSLSKAVHEVSDSKEARCKSLTEALEAIAKKKRFTADFEATVVYVNTKSELIRIQDSSSRVVACDLAPGTAEILSSLKLGNRVQVRCRWSPSMRFLLADTLEVVGQSEPITHTIQWEKGSPTKSLGRYVESKGVVKEILVKESLAYFMLKTVNGILRVRLNLSDEQTNYETFLGREVFVRGALGKYYADNGVSMGARLDLMEPSQIHFVDSSEPAKWGDRKTVQSFAGIVDAADPFRAVYVNGTRLLTQNDFSAEVDHIVNGHTVQSEDPNDPYLFLKVDRFLKVITPKSIDASRLQEVPLYSRITVEGTIQEWRRISQRFECKLESNGTRFRAVVSTHLNEDIESAVHRLHPGSLVQFTGVVCKQNADSSANETVLVRIGNPREMVLLRDAASEFRRQLLNWAILAACVLSAALLWTLMLRRQVTLRTKTIQQMSSVLKSASEAIPDGMMIFSANNQLISFNENIKNTIHEEPELHCQHSRVSELLEVQLSDREEFIAFWTSAFQNTQLVETREFATRDGHGFRSFYTAPIPDDRGNCIGRIWTISDTSMLRQIEAERVHSQKIQAIGRLAGGVAHDFNNLLAAISANLSLAVSPSLGNETARREHVAIAQGVVQRASKLTKQLLGFSRQSTLDVTVVNVGEILHDVQSLMQHTLDSSIQFSVTSSGELYACRADAMQLEQVIVNLCLNARDALQDARGSIAISAQNATHPDIGECVRISVIDNGSGISDEIKEKIFEPFFTTKAIGSGTGLGLALALGVIDQLGGKLECHSKLGQGSQFDVYLPRFEQVSPMPAPRVESDSNKTFPEQPLNVLLVDDDPILRDCGSILLSTLGHQVSCAENGEDALRILACDTTIKTVLLDLTMPVMSGTEALRIIRKDFPEVRVVICSGYSVDAAVLTQDANLMPDAILEKPYQVSDLKRALSQCV
jgi:signal transduction histidine kinase/CheY-like chemotaxis protein